MIKYKKLFFLCFIILNITSFANIKEAAENTITFYEKLKLSTDYEIRDLKNISEDLKTNFSFNKKDFNLYKGFLKEKEEFIIETTFYQNYDYVIVASADEKIQDLDIFVYDENDNPVSIDRNSRKQAVPTFRLELLEAKNLNNNANIINDNISVRPLKTGFYTIKIKANKADNNGGYWTLMILNKKTPK